MVCCSVLRQGPCELHSYKRQASENKMAASPDHKGQQKTDEPRGTPLWCRTSINAAEQNWLQRLFRGGGWKGILKAKAAPSSTGPCLLVLQRVPSSPEDPRGTQILMTADPTASFAQANDKFLVFRNDILLKKIIQCSFKLYFIKFI